MDIFCIEEFKSAVESLKKHKPYRELEKDVINYFFDKTSTEISSATLLNNNTTTPYLKKRLNGSGGFRSYYLLLIKDDKVYLMFIHPKSGPQGSSNITDEAKAKFYKRVLEAITTNELYSVSCNAKRTELVFEKVKKEKK